MSVEYVTGFIVCVLGRPLCIAHCRNLDFKNWDSSVRVCAVLRLAADRAHLCAILEYSLQRVLPRAHRKRRICVSVKYVVYIYTRAILEVSNDRSHNLEMKGMTKKWNVGVCKFCEHPARNGQLVSELKWKCLGFSTAQGLLHDKLNLDKRQQ